MATTSRDKRVKPSEGADIWAVPARIRRFSPEWGNGKGISGQNNTREGTEVRERYDTTLSLVPTVWLGLKLKDEDRLPHKTAEFFLWSSQKWEYPGALVKMQIYRFHQRPIESESLQMELRLGRGTGGLVRRDSMWVCVLSTSHGPSALPSPLIAFLHISYRTPPHPRHLSAHTFGSPELWFACGFILHDIDSN